MKHEIVRTSLFAALLLTMPMAAPAQSDGVCTPGTVAGAWGYTETGTMILPAPTGAIPYASVGRYVIDADGNVSGERTASAGGVIQKATIKGTATVLPDCTGTYSVRFYDNSGNVLGSTVKLIVYTDGAKEARLIITTGAYPTVLTTVAKRLFPAKM